MRTAVAAIALAVLASSIARADNSSQTVSVQGVLRDNTGALQSTAVGLVVSLYTSQNASSAFYSQSYTTVPVENGFFEVELAGTSLAFSSADAWIGIQIAGDSAELPRQHLAATPYAFVCGSAATAGAVSGVVPIANGGTGSSTQSFVDLSSDQTIGGNKSITASLILSSTGPLTMPLPGSGTPGTYNLTTFDHDNTGLEIQTARASDSASAAPISFKVTSRGVATAALVVTPSTTSGGTVAVNGNITATGSITPGSDIRLKKNIKTMTNGVRDLERLRPVTFDWKADGKPSLGFIAQEVEKIFPQLVVVNEQGYKLLDYDKISAVLVAAFQENRAENTAALSRLETENAVLRARLERLESQVQRLAANNRSPHLPVLTRAP